MKPLTGTLVIPIMNQLNDIKSALGLFRYNGCEDCEWMIIDNGSTDPVETFIRRYLKPKKLKYIRNEENIGLVKTMQQAYENCKTDVIIFTHSDVYIYQKSWERKIVSLFEDMPDLGGAGLFGSQGCGPIGERIQDVPTPDTMAGISNTLEAEIHGMRFGSTEPYKSASIFDGFLMAFRMEMLKKAGGFDQRYLYHHMYDRDASLTSLRMGYKNIVVNIPSHHVSGITANRPEYQTWVDKQTDHKDFTGDKYTHDHNTELFREKWKDVLPLYVEDDFSYRAGGNHPLGSFKGDAIIKMDK